ncbi:MAG: response regulator transcription factor [Bacteroidales bacterium]|nr:response regulator transcription factor [Bacteroidales bacterium]
MDEIKVIIVDDELIAIRILKQLLKKYKEINIVATAQNIDDAKNLIIQYQPDIVFLDIQLPGKNGFDLINDIKDFNIKPAIIFATSYDKYAIKAIQHSAFDYLLKPIDPVELNRAITKYISLKKETNETKQENFDKNSNLSPKIQFKTRTSLVFINTDDIIYVSAEGNYSDIFLKNNKHFIVTSYLSVVLEKLPSNTFARISRSVVINLNFLEKIIRKKKLCIVECENKRYEFKITPLYFKNVCKEK